MRISRLGLVHVLDLVIVALLLGTVLWLPVGFLVPFNDEWLRINFLSDHTLWEWIVLHSRTWVVRPTSELIMGLAALPNTRPALEHNFTAAAFLAGFRRAYLGLSLSYAATLWLNAAVLGRRWLPREECALITLGVLTCWLSSDALGFGFYWIDGYGNVLIPFALLTCGLALLARSQTLLGATLAALLVVLAALGHEVLCIYALGVLGLLLVLRRPRSLGWARFLVCAGLLLVCGGILWAQLFSEGPRLNRAGHYQTATGSAYHFDVALQNVLQIRPVQGLLSVLAPLCAVAIYRDHLRGLPERAAADFARHRAFWALLAAGTLLTSLLPLASVGLTKGRVIVDLYSTLTHLFLVLLGFLLCPMLDRWSEWCLRAYRRRVGSILPVVLVVACMSPNIASFRQAAVQREELRGQALSYMTTLFAAPKRLLNLCRPQHPYVKSARGLTDRGEADYFHLEKVRHRCPK